MAEIAKCKNCGSTDYRITLVYYGARQRLVVVECGVCKVEVIPVLVDNFAPDQVAYRQCEAAWNAANATPGAPS